MANNDSFTEVTSESWLSRIAGSIISVLFGIILFLASFVLLWFNEGRAIKTAKGLEEGASNVVSIESNTYNKNNSGKLIHTIGKVITEEIVQDEDFQIAVNALKLRRNVAMYQWVETKEEKKEKKIGGGEKTTTTYNYSKKWKNSIVKSSDFRIEEGHLNPPELPYDSFTSTVSTAAIGEFKVTPHLLSLIEEFTPYPVTNLDTVKHKNAKIINSTLSELVFIGEGTPQIPTIGDVKISFEVVESGEDYSIISKQIQNTFEPYNTQTGTKISIITKGIHSAENMFQTAQEENTTLTWILRLVGFLLMSIGLSLIVKPLVVLADVIPVLGNILDFGLIIFTGLIAFGLSFITIAIAWVVYRPIIGIPLLILGIGVIGFMFYKKKKETLEPQGLIK